MRVERHGTGDIGELHETAGAGHCQAADRGHGLGAVEQSQAFFGRQWQRRKAGALQGLGARNAFAAMEGLAFTDDNEGQMSQRGEVSACAYRALLRNDGVHAGIEHGYQQIDQLRPITAESLGEHVGAQQQHGARLGFREGISHAGGMAAHEVGLQLRQAVVRNADVGELSEAGVHAIYGLSGIEDLLDGCAAGGHARPRLGSDLHRPIRDRYGFDFGQRQRFAIENYWIHYEKFSAWVAQVSILRPGVDAPA